METPVSRHSSAISGGIFSFLQPPCHIKPAAWLPQRPVFYGVGGQLMKRQPKRLGGGRRQRDRRPRCRDTAGVTAVNVRGEVCRYQSVEIDALILHARK